RDGRCWHPSSPELHAKGSEQNLDVGNGGSDPYPERDDYPPRALCLHEGVIHRVHLLLHVVYLGFDASKALVLRASHASLHRTKPIGFIFWRAMTRLPSESRTPMSINSSGS